MTYYRVSKKDYCKDAEIGPSGNSSSLDTEIGRHIEAVLELVRSAEFPDKPKRLDGVFLFSDERCAQRYWWRMTDGRIYTVKTDEADILHSGDMMLLHEMEGALKGDRDATELARRYWRGENSQKPCEELLVTKAKIDEEVTPTSRVGVFNKLYKVSHD